MAELFKNIYNPSFFNRFTECMETVFPEFDTNSFLKEIYDQEWENRELKQRMRHITHTLKNYLTNDLKTDVEILLKLIPVLKQNDFRSDNLEFIFLPDFVEIYGIDHYDTSISAFEEITKFVSCEFAVRPFIINHPKKMIQQMARWSHHKHPMV